MGLLEDSDTGPVDALGLEEKEMRNNRNEYFCLVTKQELNSLGLQLDQGHVRHQGGAFIVGHGFVRIDGLLEVFVQPDIYDALTMQRVN